MDYTLFRIFNKVPHSSVSAIHLPSSHARETNYNNFFYLRVSCFFGLHFQEIRKGV
jgi:hypothetical protein